MTIKELAEFTGKTEKTIQRWVAKCNDKMSLPNDKITLVKGQETNLTIDQVELILKSGSMSKDAVDILMQNARGQNIPPLNAKVPTQNVEVDYNAIGQMIAIAVSSAMKPLIDQLQNAPASPKQLALPSEPATDPRAYLNKLVREYGQVKNVDFRTSWNTLYTEILYRCKVNVKVRAKNKNIRPIEVLENQNLLLTACSIMKGLIG